jgi:hypothetical protein
MNTTHKDKNILKKIEDGITSAIIIIFVLAIIAAGSGMIALPLYLFFKWGNYGKKAVPLEIKIKLSKTISIFSIIICLLIYYFIELPSLLNLLPQNDSELFIGISAVGALCYGVLYKIVKIDAFDLNGIQFEGNTKKQIVEYAKTELNKLNNYVF